MSWSSRKFKVSISNQLLIPMSKDHQKRQSWNSGTLWHSFHLGRKLSCRTESTADWTEQYTTWFHPTTNPPTYDPSQSSTVSWCIWLSSVWTVSPQSEAVSTEEPWGWSCERKSWCRNPVSEIEVGCCQLQWKLLCQTMIVNCTLLSKPVI